MKDIDTLYYICEQTSFENDYDSGFGYKVHDRGNRFYVTFEGVLQSFNRTNRNGRSYDADNIMNHIRTDPYITEQLRLNSWMGEIDHPEAEYKGQELTIPRLSKPNPSNTSHYVRSPHLEGDLLKANIQTDSGTAAGMNMAIKIVDGKITPCFSARVFGVLKNIMGKPVVIVKKLICYDWVFYPSHPEAEAIMNQPLMESVSEFEKYSRQKIFNFTELAHMAANSSESVQFLCETFNLGIDDVIGMNEEGTAVAIKENANIYLQPITDKAIRAKSQNIMRDWINR